MHFDSGKEGLEWMKTLPEENLVFFVNLIKTLYFEQPMNNDPNKLNQIKKDCKRKLQAVYKLRLRSKNEKISSLEEMRDNLTK